MDDASNAEIDALFGQSVASLETGIEQLTARLTSGGFDARQGESHEFDAVTRLDEPQASSPAQPSPYGSSAVRGMGDGEGAATSGRPLVDFSWEEPEGSANF